VPSASASELSELARRLCACIAGMSFNFNNQPAGVTASIGIALSARDGDNPESLIGAADRAMYLAKALGGNCWEFARESVGETVA
jgi:diguanylate cyclase (GGDEF)-like protein